MNPIKDKRILLICADFYGYDTIIRDTLLKLGAKDVYLHDDAHIRGSLRGVFEWKNLFYIMCRPCERTQWTKQLIHEIDNKDFDILLCIEYTPFKKWFIKWLKDKNPNIQCILFLWDKIKDHMQYFKDYFSLFDRILTFDKDDSKKYGFEYQPDFYVSDNTTPYDQCVYDMNFIGSMGVGNTSVYDRPKILSYLQKFSNQYGLRSFLYLRYIDSVPRCHRYLSILSRYERMWMPYVKEGFLHTQPLSLFDVDNKQKNTRVIVDLAYENRQGLTINAITALAKGKKLITTNKRIMNEPFYDPRNIYILDANNPQLDVDFFKACPVIIDLKKLRIDNWLKKVLNCN